MRDGHDTQVCNDAAMAILKRYDICHSDIVLLINDMTNASVVTSRLIGKRKRTLNKEIVNSFKECEDLCLAVHQIISYV